MNSNQNFELIQVISEKILPEKIKSVTWNKKIDLIAVNCEYYFEIHRIGFKHEEIFKKEEKGGIKEIIFLEKGDTETVVVMLQDTNVYFINCSNGEILLKTKLKKNENFSNEIFSEKLTCCNLTLDEENPFKNELNFNSFSKIDVSYLNYLQNKLEPCTSYIFNSKTNEFQIYLQFLINIATTKIENKNILAFKSILKSERENLILLIQKNEDKIEFNYIDLNDLFENSNRESLISKNIYQIYFSIQIIDYISNIVNIFVKIIYKLGITFFDKFIFSNSFEHELNEENEENFKKELNIELKKLMFMGNMSEGLKNLLKKDLFEAKSIIKMDENIHFNLKNIEDIFIENIKPSLNSLLFYLNEIKFNSFKISENIPNLNIQNDIDQFNYLDDLYVKFEKFISKISVLKNGYRNFLSWLSNFNTLVNSNTENSKNYLNSSVIDFNKLHVFINNGDYNMKVLYEILDSDTESNDSLNTNVNFNPFNSNYTPQNLFQDDLIKNFISLNNLQTHFNNYSFSINSNFVKPNLSIRSTLSNLKDKLSQFRFKFSNKLGEKIKLKKYLSINNPQDSIKIKNVKIKENFIFIRCQDSNESKDILNVFNIFKNVDGSLNISQLYINFKYDNIHILDYQIHNKNDLILLVKTINFEENSYFDNIDVAKYSLIVTDIKNYESWNNFGDERNANLNINSGEIIKMDKFIDVDCSESSFISCGDRGLISLIDNKKNKITILDIN